MGADLLVALGLRELWKRRAKRWWRRLLIIIGIRRITPRDGERLPDHLEPVPALDTGGAYRPSHRPQDPAVDPKEPYGSESSSRGSDHGWSGCTMSSAADALAYATGGAVAPWGGDMRHRQGDLEGGTDLYDAREAFEAYGETLTIKSGAGWSAVVAAHEEGRAIVIQGSGEVPGTGSFDGGHACCIGTETHSNGSWLFGDPLASGWQWISPGAIKTWAQHWQSSIAFAVTALPPTPDPPDPPEPLPPATVKPPAVKPPTYAARAEGYAAGYAAGLDLVFGSWGPGSGEPPDLNGTRWGSGWWGVDAWSPPWPMPLLALRAAETPAAWSASGWSAAVWRSPDATEPGRWASEWAAAVWAGAAVE